MLTALKSFFGRRELEPERLARPVTDRQGTELKIIEISDKTIPKKSLLLFETRATRVLADIRNPEGKARMIFLYLIKYV